MPNTPPDSPEKTALALFPEIDAAVCEVIPLLGRNGFHQADVELVMLGLPKRAFVPDGMKKTINRVEPIASEMENERLKAARDGSVAETETERGILLKHGGRLRIVNDGLRLFISNRLAFGLNYTAISESALNETALYRALATTAEETLAAMEHPAERERECVERLRAGVEKLTRLINPEPDSLAERKSMNVTYTLDEREAVFKELFDRKRRVKPVSALPAGERHVAASLAPRPETVMR